MAWSWAGAGGGRSVPGCRGRGWPGLGLSAELSACGDPGSDGCWQRLALLEVPFTGQGALFLLVFPLLVLLLLFLHRRGFQPATHQCGAATGAGLAPFWALPGRGAAVRAPRGATRRQGAGGGRARKERVGVIRRSTMLLSHALSCRLRCPGELWCRAPAQDQRCCRISAHVFFTDRWIAAS